MGMIEEGRKFTEDAYFTREQVNALFNSSETDEVWKNVLSYRSFFSVETDLSDTAHNPYEIVLTKTLSSSVHKLEMELMSDLVLFADLPSFAKSDFLLQRKEKSLEALTRYNGVTNASKETLSRMARGDIESIPAQLFGAHAYGEAYQQDLLEKGLNLASLGRINRLVMGDDKESNPRYRTSTPSDLVNTLLAPECKEIPSYLENLFSFLKQEDVPLLFRALSIVYVFDCLRPYEYADEETASLLAKSFLRKSPLSTIGFVLDFESIAFARRVQFFQRAKACEKSLDLTYFLTLTLPFLEQEEANLKKELLDEKMKEAPVKGDTPVMQGEESLALPYFPKAPKDVSEDTIKKLQEVYPGLRYKEAHFYSSHCTIGLFYTISQFQKEEKTVYETARTSMDDLSGRGFYKKSKINKKFVYSPIPLSENKTEEKKQHE